MAIPELLKKIERVEAPAHFEQRVLAELSARKNQRAKSTRFRLIFAGTFSAAAVMLLVFGLIVLPQRGPVAITGLEKVSPHPSKRDAQLREREIVPIVEAVDYEGEIRRMKDQPPTIYILEHVSDSTDTEIKY